MDVLQLIGVITVGVLGWGSFIAFMLWTSRENRKALEKARDPYGLKERQEKVRRTYDRQAITPLGKVRLGQDTARHRR